MEYEEKSTHANAYIYVYDCVYV